MTRRALLLTPSRGLGGGIERYVETLEAAFTTKGVEYERIDLRRPGVRAHGRLWAQARSQLQASVSPTRLILAHRTLLPAAWLLHREPSVSGISVVCHGTDVWGAHILARSYAEERLMRQPGVRVVAASNFTAGALSGVCAATVLSPGLCAEWFNMLVRASNLHQMRREGFHIVSTFRLADWRGKGLRELLSAIDTLDRRDIRVTVCGTGDPSQELQRFVRERPYCSLRHGLSDPELASLLADADIFVLATRTRAGRQASGEGFGLALLEAQVAGTPVIGPAYGGSSDAFVDSVTGVSPMNETVGALAATLRDLLNDPTLLACMGSRAAEWARERFAPERYAAEAVAKLL
jgi:phosphatidyl-myo-inositol dimannoside synthase